MDESLLLLQKTNRWTSRHLEIARVRVIPDVSAVELFGNFCPEDGDPEFETIAERLSGPTREELEKCADTMDSPADDKTGLFEDLDMILHEDVKEDRSFFKSWLKRLITEIFHQMFPEISKTYLYVNIHPRTTNLQIEVPQLSRGCMKVDGIIKKDNTEEGSVTVPLAILSVIKKKREESTEISRYEVPQCLTQAIIAYSRNPGLEQYYGLTITLDRTVVQISKATMDQAYLKSFWQDGSITKDMQLYRARKLDLLDRDGRREFARLIIGMSRFLLGSEQSTVIEKALK